MRTINIRYNQYIDSSSTNENTKALWAATYMEYKMQVQNYTDHSQYNKYSSLLAANPNAKQISFIASHCLTHYITQLNGNIPELTNNNLQLFIPYAHIDFAIEESSFTNSTLHKIAITYISKPIHWLDTIGDLMVLKLTTTPEAPTHLFRVPLHTSINYIPNTE